MLAALALLLLGIVAAVGTLNAARPSTRWWLIGPSWLAAWITAELAAHLIVLSTLAAAVLVALGALEHTVGIVGLVLLVVADVAGGIGALHAVSSRRALRDLLADLDPGPEPAPRFPRSQVVLPFLMMRRRGVAHDRGMVYAPSGMKLDVYRPAEPSGERRPAIVQVHGGAWVVGSRKEQGIPLLNHLGANGWVGVNIDYRMSPFATWPEHVVDVKRAIAWVREHADELGVDPGFVAITGGSAGGHLCALAALTAGDPAFQPGFEDADTSVQAAVPFYGVYDFVDEGRIHLPLLHSWILEPLVFKARRAEHPDRFRDASPTHRVHADAPPFLVIHGERDSLVPVADARAFVEALRAASDQPVVYAELRGAQHAFDLIPSPRTAPTVEAIERFLHTIQTGESADVRVGVAAAR